MSAVSRGLSRYFLRHGSLVAELRKIPIFGPLLSWGSRKLLPSDTLVWAEIQRGHARGLWVCVNPRSGQAVQRGDGEPAVQIALVEYLRPGMIFYDVGVVSFEADPEIAARLRENLARNGFDQARVVQSAVWSELTTVFFARVDVSVSPDRGLGHVAVQRNSADTIAVDAIALDDFLDSDRQPDFIKCDVEGAEAAVFAGAENLLRKKRPILLVEMHSAENHRALTRKFFEFGYNCRDLDENHVLALPQ